jgi:hypothetical protein
MDVATMEETINALLKPLNMHLCQNEDGWGWHIVENTYHTAILFKYANKYAAFAETHLPKVAGLDSILNIIQKTEQWVFSSFARLNGIKNVSNPYFRCNSLEEMLIRKDLIA